VQHRTASRAGAPGRSDLVCLSTTFDNVSTLYFSMREFGIAQLVIASLSATEKDH
jgi:hypothetical protein